MCGIHGEWRHPEENSVREEGVKRMKGTKGEWHTAVATVSLNERVDQRNVHQARGMEKKMRRIRRHRLLPCYRKRTEKGRTVMIPEHR